jgi:hypothetical protein
MLPLVGGAAELPNVLCTEDLGAVEGVLGSRSKIVGASSALTDLTSRGLRELSSPEVLVVSPMVLDN